MRMHPEQQTPAPTVVLRQAHRLGVAQFDQREFGGNEEAIQQHQQQCHQQQQHITEHGVRLRAVHRRWVYALSAARKRCCGVQKRKTQVLRFYSQGRRPWRRGTSY
ncbi:hypothetical protein [Xanthomonas hortorum]|uniref:hypothetical protein n=1 Tax=Xanthomonas hortorum TaxID=56454 RepID=UPI001F18D9F9|nr:hypothetical protein [Xanthomonas hortorum]MCE4358006.1 hypothetical protein [Xanthomonas hortorum pv. taraxaci]